MTQNTVSLSPSPQSMALAISNPGSLGTIDAYIAAVNQMPMLTAEQETALALRYREREDLDAARDLVLSHLRLVVAVARQYLGYGLPHADLIQEGNVGLMKAVKRFDPSRGVRLVSFAIHWIKAEIHEYVIRNWRMVKVATTKAQRKLFFNLRSMKQSGDTLTPDEIEHISHALNVREQDVREMEMRMTGREMALDGRDDEDDYAPSAWLSDEGAEEPTQVLERRARDELQSTGITRALDVLDPRSRRIIEARWLPEGDSATLQELANEFGVSAERIRQIESRALGKMRGELAQAA
ncbi:RNA polymerase sigma factor RpoH [Verticiella sediminum]|uniref:RNA polymerase sigma factor RpoH n=2 Tax=Verticiella sediminum TaxID=1247510 RepID=A0A556B104_9BURK|nr:RNA polymerase sigma factor RpoH [Verticiella sediminum]